MTIKDCKDWTPCSPTLSKIIAVNPIATPQKTRSHAGGSVALVFDIETENHTQYQCCRDGFNHSQYRYGNWFWTWKTHLLSSWTIISRSIPDCTRFCHPKNGTSRKIGARSLYSIVGWAWKNRNSHHPTNLLTQHYSTTSQHKITYNITQAASHTTSHHNITMQHHTHCHNHHPHHHPFHLLLERLLSFSACWILDNKIFLREIWHVTGTTLANGKVHVLTNKVRW